MAARLTQAEWAEVEAAIDKHQQELGDNGDARGLAAMNRAVDKLAAARRDRLI